MKNVIFGLALAAITFACASEPKASVSENAAPKAECSTEGKSECSDKAKMECSDEAKMECSDEAKAECASEAKTCPVTGQQIN